MIDFTGASRINDVAAKRITKGIGRPGDVLLSHKGTVGKIARAPHAAPPFVCSPQTTFWRTLDENRLDGRYLHVLMRSPFFSAQLASRAGETDMAPYVSLTAQRSFKLIVPELPRQRAIADIISTLDDKIDVNRRMNETLEASARALFRDWFVDFGPTRAKAEGRPAYLAHDLWSLFPDRLNDDGVPEGWEWSTIGEEVEAVGGSTPSTKDVALWDGGIAWTTPKDLSDLGSPILLDTARTITEAGLRTISSGLLPAGTVLMSSRAPVGYLAIASVPLAINQGYIAMKCTGRVSNWSVYLWAHENMGAIISNANGSTFQEISKKNFRPLPILVADDATRSAFDSLVGPMFESITTNVIEARTLAAIRDALLPKLMSGEIQISSAETKVTASL